MNCVIMVSAKQQAGKSTLVQELLRQSRRGPENKTGLFDFVHVEKFANTIYELHDGVLNKMAELTGKPRVEKDGDLLQLLGTEWGRNKLGNDVWVNITRDKVQKIIGDYKNIKSGVFIDDLRFENEFHSIPQAFRVRLECPESVRKIRGEATGVWRENVNHPSEIGLDNYAAQGRFDLYIYTDPDDPRYTDVKGSASLILKHIQAGNWVEGRNHAG